MSVKSEKSSPAADRDTHQAIDTDENNIRRNAVLARLSQPEREALLAFKEALIRHFGSEFLYIKLFGSRARGERQGQADLDVLVMLKDSNYEIDRRVIHIAVEMNIKHDVLLDAHVTKPSWWQEGLNRELLFYHEVEREGILI